MTFKFGLWSGNFWNHKVLKKSKTITAKSLSNHTHKILIILTIYKLVKFRVPHLLHKNRAKVHKKHHRRNHKMNLPIFRLFPKQTIFRKLNFKPLNKRMKPPRALPRRRVHRMFGSAFWALCLCSISYSINSFWINQIDCLLTQIRKRPCPGILGHVNLDGNRSCDLT